MKEWNEPKVEELSIAETASGSDPSNAEQNGYFSGGWHNATYDSNNFEKCDVGDTYAITKKKNIVAS